MIPSATRHRASGPPPPLPMDAYLSGMLFAYSLTHVLSAYSGPLIRVRRDSDNAEQDIGFVTGGALNTAALLAFVGSGSGFITKWYDQNLTVDAVQTTTTLQPAIVTSGTYLGEILFDGIDDFLTTHTPAVTALSFAANVALNPIPGSSNASFFIHPLIGTSGNNGLTFQYQNGDNNFDTYAFTGSSNFSQLQSVSTSTFIKAVLIIDRTSYPPILYTGGLPNFIASNTTGTPTSAAFTDQDLTIGAAPGAVQPGKFHYTQLYAWTVNQDANHAGINAAL